MKKVFKRNNIAKGQSTRPRLAMCIKQEQTLRQKLVRPVVVLSFLFHFLATSKPFQCLLNLSFKSPQATEIEIIFLRLSGAMVR